MSQSITTGERQNGLLLDQYKLYIELADNVSARRANASKFYVSLLTALFAVIPFILEKDTPPHIPQIVLSTIGVLGIVLCFLWAVNIRSYRQLNSLKFKVIHEMEERLPFPCYRREWQILEEEKGTRTYLRLSQVEQYVPLVLTIPYLILVIYTLIP